ncbi:hypothetical protein FSP39_024880, partial [Pinctada imbricata]
VNVTEDSTGVLFSLPYNQDGWGQYTFRIKLVTPDNIFAVDQNGNVSLAAGKHLDYDHGPREYELHLELISTGGGNTVREIQVELNVLDVNDENPFFTNKPSPYLATVRQTDPIGTLIYKMEAEDPDADYNNTLQLEYRLGSNIGFQINPTSGEIRTSRMFNQASDPGNEFTLQVIVKDTVPPGNQEATASVLIRVGDRAPQFYADLYTVNVLENSAPGSRLSLMGTTATTNSPQSMPFNFQSRIGGATIYSIYDSNNTTSNIFTVENGKLVSQRILSIGTDETEYNLTLRAQDNSSGLSSDTSDHNGQPSENVTALIVVYVENENDFAPEFIHQSVSTIPDDLGSGSTVMNVRAIDKDGDKIRYSFTGGATGTSYFSIDPDNGRITLAGTIPPDGPNTFNIPVYATDDGSCCNNPGVVHTSQQNITINIVDSMNRKPVFTDCTQYYTTAVYENENSGTFVAQVSATDSNRGDNGEISYAILSFRGPDLTSDFYIDPNSGNITTMTRFNRESINSIVKVTVIAEDKGQPPLKDECTFPITILDQNDNAPKFLFSGDRSLRTAWQGIIEHVGGFCRNDVGDKEVTVMAQDKGDPPLNTSATLKIEVLDSQQYADLPPEWIENNPWISIDDSTRTNDAISTFNITSSNITAVGIIHDCEAQAQTWTYFRLIGSNNNRFTRLVAAKSLQDAPRSQRIMLRATRTIGQQGSISDVASDMYPMISLVDTNDRVPSFENRLNSVSQNVEFSVTENQTAPISVGTLFANDADLTSPYNKVSYRLARAVDGFAINNSTGEITTTKRFDRETGQHRYDLSVLAVDGAPSSDPNMGGNPNTGSVAVRITIGDVNDNIPYFSQNLYRFAVSESQSVGDVVGNITAQDLDDDLTSQYTKYSISSDDASHSSLFSVKETTGEILVANVLSGRSDQDVRLTFTADDGRFKASVPVIITITKSYVRLPIFDGNYDIKNIVANRTYDGETVFKVLATDPDCITGSCGITYAILTNDPSTHTLFHIDQTSGNVTLNGVLDNRQYSFTVSAAKTSNRKKRNTVQPQPSYAAVYIDPALCNANQCPTPDGRCLCCDFCASSPCQSSGATCQNVCTADHAYGYICLCPTGYTGRLCDIELAPVTPAARTDDVENNTWLIILLVCLAVVIIATILILSFLYKRRRKTDDKESMFVYDNEDYDIREDVINYDEEGAGDEDYQGFDISVISKPTNHNTMSRPDRPRDLIVKENVQQQGSVQPNQLRGFIKDRLSEAEDDPGAPPYDTLREFAYEGSGSDAGSLSSIETTTSGGSQDYDYLHNWGPKFARLADMYNTYEDSD